MLRLYSDFYHEPTQADPVIKKAEGSRDDQDSSLEEDDLCILKVIFGFRCEPQDIDISRKVKGGFSPCGTANKEEPVFIDLE